MLSAKNIQAPLLDWIGISTNLRLIFFITSRVVGSDWFGDQIRERESLLQTLPVSGVSLKRTTISLLPVSGLAALEGSVSNVDIDRNNTLRIKAIGAAISTFETLPTRTSPPLTWRERSRRPMTG